MFGRPTTLSLLVIYGVRSVFSQIKPTTPGPNETYTAGSSCKIAWIPDFSGSWRNFSIDLMSGSNLNMSLVTNVANELDGTDKSLTPYSWTCPEVDPYSAIYFYQFTNEDDISTRTWTSRFMIASPSDESEPPEYPQQPNGDSIPWGVGHIKESTGTQNNATTISSVTVSEFDNDSAPQATLAIPSSSSDDSESIPGRNKPHKYKSEPETSGDTTDDSINQTTDQEDSETYDSEDDTSESDTQYGDSEGTRSTTHATTMAHQHVSSPNPSSEDDPDQDANDEDGPGSDSEEPNSSRDSGTTDEADGEDEISKSKCRCEPDYGYGYATGGSTGLKRGDVGMLFMFTSFTLAVLYL